MKQPYRPSALLLTSTHCPHCHVLQDLLQQRYQHSTPGLLQIINIDDSPDVARSHQVRSVPWLKLGSFEFDGVMTPAELDHWIGLTSQTDASSYYLEHLLADGKLTKAIAWIEKNNESLGSLLLLMVKDDVKMNVRIGIGAIMEHFENTRELTNIIPLLTPLANHTSATVRADVCHYLMLSHSERVIPIIQSMLIDEDAQVREIARESLEEL